MGCRMWNYHRASADCTTPCLPAKRCERAASSHPVPPCKVVRSGQPPISPCLPCVRGGAERMRSGGVVGRVQEKAACYRKPVPIRHLQPLSQGLSALPAPLTQGSQALRGTKAPLRGSQALRGTEASLRGSQALRGTEASLSGSQAPRGREGECSVQRKQNAVLVSYARQLRKNMTPHERRLWFCFLKQYPVRFVR